MACLKKTGILACGLALAGSLLAAPPKTEANSEAEVSLNRPYAYFANGESLNSVLQNLGRNFGLSVKLGGTFKDAISGRVGGETAADMLNRLSEMFGFNWFIFGRTLYVSPGNDRIVQRIRVTPGSADSLKQALTDIGLITPRFGWGSLPEEDTVIVTGPREYVNLVMTTLAKFESNDSITTMVFKLKYASVEDRRIQLRDREVVTRGLASILTGLLTRGGKSATSTSGGTTSPGQPLTPVPGKLVEGGSDASNKSSGGESSRNNSGGPTIESDARLNAIIIRDHVSKQRMYADLIAELDVPTPLVEIEASIIEIDQNKFDEIGAELRYRSGAFGIQTNSSDNSQTGTRGGIAMNFGSGSTSVIKDLAGFYATLRLLESSGEAKTLAKPAVLTLDNLGAVLDLTDTSYTSVIGEKVANIVPVTVGTLLRVTPHVIFEDSNLRIQLAVDIEDGSQDSGANSNVRVKKTNISTQAIIEPNQSLLIAGYSLETESAGSSGIPVLGKLPILGPLFSTRSTSTKRLKRLFLITPRVMSQDGAPISTPGGSASNRSPAQGAKRLPAPAVNTGAPAPQLVLPPLPPAPPPTPVIAAPRPVVVEPPPSPTKEIAPAAPATGIMLYGPRSLSDVPALMGTSEAPPAAPRGLVQPKPSAPATANALTNASPGSSDAGVRNKRTYTVPKVVTTQTVTPIQATNSTGPRADADFSKPGSKAASNAAIKPASKVVKRKSIRFDATSQSETQ